MFFYTLPKSADLDLDNFLILLYYDSMKLQSLKSKIILLAVFIILVVGIAVGVSLGTKRKHDKSMYKTFTATYTADENGTICGEAKQSVRQWLDGTEITAVPNDGYLFSGWSDGVYLPTRHDTHFTQNIEVNASFVSKLKTLKYDYNGATANNSVSSVTINYDSITSTKFVIPAKANFEFQGWYLDKEFTKRVTDKDGVYYLGKSIFYSEADTLYARWEKHEGIVYPVLMIFVDEIHAKLDTVDKQIFNLDYKMILPELKISEQIPEIISEFLNDGFNGKVHFELDAYYTNTTLDTNCYKSGLSYYGNYEYYIFPPNMAEVAPILKNYRSVLTFAAYKDPDGIIHQAAGYGSNKFACIPLDDIYYRKDFLKPLTGTNSIQWNNIIPVYTHEFIHTIEQAIGLNNLHDYEIYYKQNTGQSYLSGHLLYLLNKAEMNGNSTGVPLTYWTGNIEVEYHYDAQKCSEMGAVRLIENNIEHEPSISRAGKIPYGSDLTVEAVAKDGYKFIKWSDGVTTAIRHDTNITSYLYVFPIFAKEI